MPELPEVEVTVRDLEKKIIGRKIVDIWTDAKKLIKKPKNFELFKKEVIGKKIKKIFRRGKNILFEFENQKLLLLHQKLTGHLLLGKWKITKLKSQTKLPTSPGGEPLVKSLIRGPLEEPINQFIHLIFYLDNGEQLALSDLRKFAKLEIWHKNELENSKEFKSLGPEPLEESFTFEKFKEILSKRKGMIKKVLMDQKVIAGIGNIYSDEILWEAKINPKKEAKTLSEDQLKKIYFAIKKILKKAIELGGESISDFRRIDGKKGGFDPKRKVYRRENEKCFRCQSLIKKIKFGQRSSYFCPSCQKI